MTSWRRKVISAMIAKCIEARPRWHGWMARRYGPAAKHVIRYMPKMYWHMEGRALFTPRPGKRS